MIENNLVSQISRKTDDSAHLKHYNLKFSDLRFTRFIEVAKLPRSLEIKFLWDLQYNFIRNTIY